MAGPHIDDSEELAVVEADEATVGLVLAEAQAAEVATVEEISARTRARGQGPSSATLSSPRHPHLLLTARIPARRSLSLPLRLRRKPKLV